MKWLILLILFPTGAGALTAEQARTAWQRSLEFYRKEDFTRSRNLLLHLVKAQPDNALYWFNLGNSYFMLKQYPYAETCFYRVETLASPLAPAARLYRAKALTARGETDSARLILQGLSASPKIPPAIRDEAGKDLLALNGQGDAPDPVAEEALSLYQKGKYRRALRVILRSDRTDENLRLLKALILIKLEREDAAQLILRSLQRDGSAGIRHMARSMHDRLRDTYSKPKWVFTEGFGGHDSNLDRAAGGDAGASLFLLAGAGGRFWTRELWYATAGYSARWREAFGHEDLRSISHEARLNVGREVAADLILVSPYLSHDSWDASARRAGTGVTARWRTGTEGFEVGIDADLVLDHALNEEQKYLAGLNQNYVAYAGWIDRPFYVRGLVKWSRADIADRDLGAGAVLPEAYRSVGPGVSVLWRLRRDFAAEASLLYLMRDYPTAARPGNELREDKESQLSLRLTKILSPAVSVYTTAAYAKNESTLGPASVSNENYSQTQLMAGVIWDAL